MEAISRIWYNGSYTIAAKPIKTLELHYTMIQFLIITCRPQGLQGLMVKYPCWQTYILSCKAMGESQMTYQSDTEFSSNNGKTFAL